MDVNITDFIQDESVCPDVDDIQPSIGYKISPDVENSDFLVNDLEKQYNMSYQENPLPECNKSSVHEFHNAYRERSQHVEKQLAISNLLIKEQTPLKTNETHSHDLQIPESVRFDGCVSDTQHLINSCNTRGYDQCRSAGMQHKHQNLMMSQLTTFYDVPFTADYTVSLPQKTSERSTMSSSLFNKYDEQPPPLVSTSCSFGPNSTIEQNQVTTLAHSYGPEFDDCSVLNTQPYERQFSMTSVSLCLPDDSQPLFDDSSFAGDNSSGLQGKSMLLYNNSPRLNDNHSLFPGVFFFYLKIPLVHQKDAPLLPYHKYKRLLRGFELTATLFTNHCFNHPFTGHCFNRQQMLLL